MSENDKHNLSDLHAAGGEEHHEHRAGHLDDGEPITDSDINYGSVVFISIIGSLLTVVVVYALVGLYGSSIRTEQFAKRVGKDYEINYQQFALLREAQRAELSGEPRWTVPDKDLVSVPMDEAIKAAFIEAEARRATDLRAASAPVAAEAEPTAEESVGEEPVEGPSEGADSATAADETEVKEGN